MGITSKLQHDSNVDANIFYTSYTWSFSHWTLLYDCYKEGILSPKFEVMGPKSCQCSLKFDVQYPTVDKYRTESSIIVNFTGDRKPFFMRASVSIVHNKTLAKMLTAESPAIDSTRNNVTIPFGLVILRAAPLYLCDDTLTLLFELHAMNALFQTPIKTNTWSSNFNAHVWDKLARYCGTDQLTDISFNVRNQTISANKLILAVHSDLFETAFTSDAEKEIRDLVENDDVDPEMFKILIKYMYTGTVEDMDKVVTELVALAHKFQVIDLVNTCTTYMGLHLKITNAVPFLITGSKLGCKSLVDQSVRFIQCNTEILANPEELKMLTEYPELSTQVFRR